jgi:hypothetical protein
MFEECVIRTGILIKYQDFEFVVTENNNESVPVCVV